MPRPKTQRNTKPIRKMPMNAREHLYAFAGLLTTRKATIICNSSSDASVLGQLVGAYADANNLTRCRENAKRPNIPVGTDHLTNVPTDQQPTLDPHGALAKIFALLSSFTPADQNTIIGKLLSTVKYQRNKRHEYTTEAREKQTREEILAYQSMRDFENIMSGNFTVLD